MEKDANLIRWGILGCGKIAHKFAQDLLTVSNARLEAVASRSLAKSEKFGERYKAHTSYDAYLSLCTDPSVDVIYIATPHAFHFEHSMLCLQHSKAVLCEKPFALNSQEVQQMIALAQKKNVFLMEAMWTLFLPHFQYVLNLIASNELGAITHLKADFGYPFDFDPNSRIYNRSLGGGSLLDIGIYPVMAALSMLGVPDKIEATAQMSSTGVDESCSMQFEYKNDICAALFSSVVDRTNTEAILTFEKGTVKIHSRFHQPSHVTVTKGKKLIEKEFEVPTNGYNYEAEHVSTLLLDGVKESPVMTFDRSLQLIQTLDQIRDKIGLTYR